jgi:hypothetical protein
MTIDNVDDKVDDHADDHVYDHVDDHADDHVYDHVDDHADDNVNASVEVISVAIRIRRHMLWRLVLHAVRDRGCRAPLPCAQARRACACMFECM